MEKESEDITPKGFNVVDGILIVVGVALLAVSSLANIDSYCGASGVLALGAGIRGLIARSG